MLKTPVFAGAIAGVIACLAQATVEAQIGPQEGIDNLITRGRNGFFNNTFNGNGRTCGTCHREDESLTINAQFISALPMNDPLFVAETQPALATNFENPILMRKFGLILENVDGFENLGCRDCSSRGVPTERGAGAASRMGACPEPATRTGTTTECR